MGAATNESLTRDNLVAGTFPQITETATIVSGAGALARGTVLGKITASGKLVTVDSAGTDDGRRAPYAVLAEAVDATSADKVAGVYLSGEYNEDALVFGGTDTKDTHRAELRKLGIYLKPRVK